MSAILQLAKLHGLEIPMPEWAAYRDWSEDPYGGAWHFWRIGAQSANVIPQIREPLESQPLFVCGEAWSLNQGWVEGALMTAERLMQAEFGLSSPSKPQQELFIL